MAATITLGGYFAPSMTLAAPLNSTISQATSADISTITTGIIKEFKIQVPTIGEGTTQLATFIKTDSVPVVTSAGASSQQSWYMQ